MLKLVPLGGLGEVGLNALLLESNSEALLVDCGVMFAGEDMPGVELVLPDLGHLVARSELLRGVVLTHGHEDHLGAVPHLLGRIRVPVYGTRLTLAFLRHRLEEESLDAELREISPGRTFQVGSAFTVEPIRVCHSIPDSIGLAIRTEEGLLVHSGDFKLDPAPIHAEATDLPRFAQLGEEGVLCLMSDSTNAELEEESGSERAVAEELARLLSGAEGRVVVAVFASNLSRVQHLLDLAARVGRRVVLAGRSMIRNVELASSLGYLRVPPGVLASAEEASSIPPRRLALLTTGSQAEPRSGLWQMAFEAGRQGGIQSGDLVVISSRPIPGNERAVAELCDRLYELGARVAYGRADPRVHVSGHAGRSELRRLIEAVRPRCFLPVHGELRQLRRHLELARSCGVPEGGLLLARDGEVVELSGGRPRLSGRVPTGRVLLDRFGGGELSEAALKERRALGDAGVVVAVAVVDRDSGKLLVGPELCGRGLTREEAASLAEVAERARALLREAVPAALTEEAVLKDELVRAVRRAFKPHSGKRPNVFPVVVRLGPE
ncbi:MAG: ribonuclease J [Myxococcales bacterium]|nr:ribonuclease J [Myxococcales bacterium]